MPQYRNVSGDVRWVDLGHGRPTKVGDGEIATFPDDYPFYVQTGETGEVPLWQLVAPPKKSAKAEKE